MFRSSSVFPAFFGWHYYNYEFYCTSSITVCVWLRAVIGKRCNINEISNNNSFTFIGKFKIKRKNSNNTHKINYSVAPDLKTMTIEGVHYATRGSEKRKHM